jgi:hypothetical protein
MSTFFGLKRVTHRDAASLPIESSDNILWVGISYVVKARADFFLIDIYLKGRGVRDWLKIVQSPDPS